MRLNLENLDWELNSTHHDTIAPLNVIFCIGDSYTSFLSQKVTRHHDTAKKVMPDSFGSHVWVSQV